MTVAPMRWMTSRRLSMALMMLVACADDADVGAGADGSTSDATGATMGETDAADETADDGACQLDSDCDDAEPCTADVCEEGVCGVDGVVESNECRP
ncbi:MAG: hypothetical protein K0V04_28885, partial [Deltaproteobacteria bacterium]|nr:hypothetical protein [Deltaproteobacteria bacterium]